jgi:hypothetical protein
MSRQDEINKLICIHNRRLQILKEQKAVQGGSVDPKIIIEIEDIEAELGNLKAEILESRYDEHSSFCLVSGLSLASLFQNLCVIISIDECRLEIEAIDKTFEKANIKFRVANYQKEIEKLFRLSGKQRIILVGKFASEWPDIINADLEGYNSHLFTFGTLMTTPLFYGSMDSSQLNYFYSKLDIAYRNTSLPQRFFDEFKRDIKILSESNPTHDEYKTLISQFGQELIAYIDMNWAR